MNCALKLEKNQVIGLYEAIKLNRHPLKISFNHGLANGNNKRTLGLPSNAEKIVASTHYYRNADTWRFAGTRTRFGDGAFYLHTFLGM